MTLVNLTKCWSLLWNFKVVLDHKLIGSWSLRSAVPRWLWFLDLTLQYNMAEPAYQ